MLLLGDNIQMISVLHSDSNAVLWGQGWHVCIWTLATPQPKRPSCPFLFSWFFEYAHSRALASEIQIPVVLNNVFRMWLFTNVPVSMPCFCFVSSLISSQLGDSPLYLPLALHRDVIHFRVEVSSSLWDYTETHGRSHCCSIDIQWEFSHPLLPNLLPCLLNFLLFFLLSLSFLSPPLSSSSLLLGVKEQ